MFPRKPVGEVEKPKTVYLPVSQWRCIEERAREMGLSTHAYMRLRLTSDGCEAAVQSG